VSAASYHRAPRNATQHVRLEHAGPVQPDSQEQTDSTPQVPRPLHAKGQECAAKATSNINSAPATTRATAASPHGCGGRMAAKGAPPERFWGAHMDKQRGRRWQCRRYTTAAPVLGLPPSNTQQHPANDEKVPRKSVGGRENVPRFEGTVPLPTNGDASLSKPRACRASHRRKARRYDLIDWLAIATAFSFSCFCPRRRNI